MDFAKRWGTVWDDDCRRCQCVCLDTGATSEKRSPVKRERSGSRDSASSSRSSRASSKSRRESPPLGCLEISDVDGESLGFPWNWEGGTWKNWLSGRGRGPGGVGQDPRLRGAFPGRCGPVPSEGLCGWGQRARPSGSGFGKSGERGKVKCSRGVWSEGRRRGLTGENQGGRRHMAEGEGSANKTPESLGGGGTPTQ